MISKLLLLILLPGFLFCQTIYKGTVINKQTKEKVPFTTVGLVKENTGINADENGEYNLSAKASYPNDTLLISSVGYKSLRIPVSKLSSIIELEEKPKLLEPVVIYPNEKKTFTKLNYDFDHTNLGITSRIQLAKYFTTSADHAILTEVKISESKQLFESHKARFRIRVYDLDTAKMSPSADLCAQVIEVNTGNRITKVNLEKYKIHVGRIFFVAIEWLKIPYNEHRFKSTDERTGIKSEYVEYRPVIGGKNMVDRASIYFPGNSAPVWTLNYQGIWMPFIMLENVGIGATIRY